MNFTQVKNADLSETSSEDMFYFPSPGSSRFEKALVAEPLVFRAVDGRIVSVRPSVREPRYITNIKRGILSALQVQLTHLTETVQEVTSPSLLLVGDRYPRAGIRDDRSTLRLGSVFAAIGYGTQFWYQRSYSLVIRTSILEAQPGYS